jgi:hypothetical protein
MTSKHTLGALVLCAGLSACGGGGGGGSAFPTAFTPGNGPDADRDTVVLGVALFDAVAGLERMLAAVPSGTERLVGGDVSVSPRIDCAGGGDITTRKAGGVFTLTATNCRLLTTDNLVYDGEWVVTVTSDYASDGTCPAGNVCSANGTVDLTSARFGYGSADDPVFGSSLQVNTTGAGVRTTQVSVANESVPLDAGGTATLSGPRVALQLAGGGLDLLVAGSLPRGNLQLTNLAGTYQATVTLGSQVTAAIDRDANGSIDRMLAIPWSSFVD